VGGPRLPRPAARGSTTPSFTAPQGTKTLAYELWEDLGFRAPQHVILPCGAGSTVLGCDLGFSELLSAGEISRLPRLWAAQPLRCSPIASAVLAVQVTIRVENAGARETIMFCFILISHIIQLTPKELSAEPKKQCQRRSASSGQKTKRGIEGEDPAAASIHI